MPGYGLNTNPKFSGGSRPLTFRGRDFGRWAGQETAHISIIPEAPGGGALLPSVRPSGCAICGQGEEFSADVWDTSVYYNLPLIFKSPLWGLHHCCLSDPNLPVATRLWLQTCGSGLDLVFSFSTCVCRAAGTRIDLRSISAPQRVAFSWATASGPLPCYSIYRLQKGSSRAEGCLGWV